MFRALFIASTGMSAQQFAMDTVSNNLSNVNTHGFKATGADFEDLYSETLQEPTARRLPIQAGLGVRIAGSSKSMQQGSLQTTGNSYDLAIQGQGFFPLVEGDGSLVYTRAGNFHLDAEGRLTHASGRLVDGDIQVPEGATDVTISNAGVVSAMPANSSTRMTLGTIDLAKFTNPQGLLANGDSTYKPSEGSGEAVRASQAFSDSDFGTITQGTLEASNVNMVSEMVKLIMVQRAYETNSKVLSASDEMMGYANNLRR